MNTKLIIWILGIFLGAIVIAILWYVVFAPKAPPPPPPLSTGTLPISGSIRPTPSTSSPSATTTQGEPAVEITTYGGNIVLAKDFIHNGTTINDTANSGWYLLAGNLGYCTADPKQCQAAPANNFSVYYDSAVQSFIITLTEEPLGQARSDAEQFLLATLGLTQSQMCSLSYLIGVTKYVSEQYAGKNIGFSFCPGATTLPK